MADFTGLNPLVAQSNISEFEDQGLVIYYNLSYYNKLFIDSLASVWFSPKAVEFGATYVPKIYNAEEETKVLVNNTIVDCVAAYNAMAESQGIASCPDTHIGIVDKSNQGTNANYEHIKDISGDGAVGMDVEKVRAYQEEYRNNINSIKGELDNFPLSIAFYDPQGELLAAFTNQVKHIKEELDRIYEDMAASITAALEVEQKITVNGAREAATAMTSGN